MSRAPHIIAQGAAAVIAEQLERLQTECIEQLAKQDAACAAGHRHIDAVRRFVGTPERIIGNPNTKHGEIAEQVEIGVRNAWDALNRRSLSAEKASARTGSIDYFINGTAVQSKFSNKIVRGLDEARKHMEQNPDFIASGGYYHIPKDHHEIIQRILNHEPVPELNDRSIRHIRTHLEGISAATGRLFGDIVRPSVSSYADVQQGRVHSVLVEHDNKLESDNKTLKQQINAKHQPGWKEAGSAAATGAAIGGALRFGTTVWRKASEGRNLFRGEFTLEDWQELGLETATGAAQGGIAAGAIFVLTAQAGLAAPFAGAFVSSAMGVAALVGDYQSGKIDMDQFIELGMLTCCEGAVVGLAAVAGQTLIPIPVVGAMIGSAAGRLLVALAQAQFNEAETAFAARMAKMHGYVLAGLDEAYRDLIDQLDRYFDDLATLTSRAFNLELNAELHFIASVQLAQFHGVAHDKMVRSRDEIDIYMKS
jgi:hypothetical protein